jgi:hypothetical protein
MKWAALLNKSIITIMKSQLLGIVSCVIMSIPISNHGLVGTANGCNKPAEDCLEKQTDWHEPHKLKKSMTSFLMEGQSKKECKKYLDDQLRVPHDRNLWPSLAIAKEKTSNAKTSHIPTWKNNHPSPWESWQNTMLLKWQGKRVKQVGNIKLWSSCRSESEEIAETVILE